MQISASLHNYYSNPYFNPFCVLLLQQKVAYVIFQNIIYIYAKFHQNIFHSLGVKR